MYTNEDESQTNVDECRRVTRRVQTNVDECRRIKIFLLDCRKGDKWSHFGVVEIMQKRCLYIAPHNVLTPILVKPIFLLFHLMYVAQMCNHLNGAARLHRGMHITNGVQSK